MAVQLLQLFSRINCKNAIYISSRNAGYWNYDWSAGKKPKTPAEREIAAKKYGLRSDDYEVYGEDEYQPAGDYPKLPLFFNGRKDPFADYDYSSQKRNYGEPLPFNADLLREGFGIDLDEEKYDLALTHKVNYLINICVVLIVAGLCYIGDKYIIFNPLKPKQFPYWKKDGPHYTFEKLDSS